MKTKLNILWYNFIRSEYKTYMFTILLLLLMMNIFETTNFNGILLIMVVMGLVKIVNLLEKIYKKL